MKTTLLSLVLFIGFSLVVQAQPPKLDIVVKRNKSSKKDTDYVDDNGNRRNQSDDGSNIRTKSSKTESFQIEASIKSKEFRRAFKNLTGMVFVLGKSVNDGSYTLLAKKSEKFDLNPKKVVVVKTDAITLKSTKDGRKESGQEYGGYVVVVMDEDGDVIKSRASRSSALKKLDALKSAKPGAKIRL